MPLNCPTSEGTKQRPRPRNRRTRTSRSSVISRAWSWYGNSTRRRLATDSRIGSCGSARSAPSFSPRVADFKSEQVAGFKSESPADFSSEWVAGLRRNQQLPRKADRPGEERGPGAGLPRRGRRGRAGRRDAQGAERRQAVLGRRPSVERWNGVGEAVEACPQAAMPGENRIVVGQQAERARAARPLERPEDCVVGEARRLAAEPGRTREDDADRLQALRKGPHLAKVVRLDLRAAARR